MPLEDDEQEDTGEKDKPSPENIKWIELVEPSQRAFLHVHNEETYVVRPYDEMCILLSYNDPILEVVNVGQDSHKMVVDSAGKEEGTKSQYVTKILSSKRAARAEVLCPSAVEECERSCSQCYFISCHFAQQLKHI